MNLDRFEKINLFLIFFFGASLVVFVLMNGGAFAAEIRYDLLWNSPFISNDLKTENIADINASSTGATRTLTDAEKKNLTLIIPKIDAKAPIVLASEDSNKGILSALEEGVGLYPDSGTPGENGRAIILGHSSRATWYRGGYAYVFALLPKLDVGDEFYVTTGSAKLEYVVFARDIFTKDQANALYETPAIGSEIDLMTCYPIGSASKRTVIQAKLVKTEAL